MQQVLHTPQWNISLTLNSQQTHITGKGGGNRFGTKIDRLYLEHIVRSRKRLTSSVCCDAKIMTNISSILMRYPSKTQRILCGTSISVCQGGYRKYMDLRHIYTSLGKKGLLSWPKIWAAPRQYVLIWSLLHMWFLRIQTISCYRKVHKPVEIIMAVIMTSSCTFH